MLMCLSVNERLFLSYVPYLEPFIKKKLCRTEFNIKVISRSLKTIYICFSGTTK